jgi:hypothetical protein
LGGHHCVGEHRDHLAQQIRRRVGRPSGCVSCCPRQANPAGGSPTWPGSWAAPRTRSTRHWPASVTGSPNPSVANGPRHDATRAAPGDGRFLARRVDMREPGLDGLISVRVEVEGDWPSAQPVASPQCPASRVRVRGRTGTDWVWRDTRYNEAGVTAVFGLPGGPSACSS